MRVCMPHRGSFERLGSWVPASYRIREGMFHRRYAGREVRTGLQGTRSGPPLLVERQATHGGLVVQPR